MYRNGFRKYMKICNVIWVVIDCFNDVKLMRFGSKVLYNLGNCYF